MKSGSSGGWDRRLILPFVLFVITSIYLATALQITAQFDEGLVGPSFVPVVASILMYIALAFVVLGMRNDTDKAAREKLNLAAPLKVVVATAVYILAFKPLGYPVSTFLYVYALLYIFGLEDTGPLKRIAYTAAITAVFYALFALIFQVRLPLFDTEFWGMF
ncbi:tripartite tricarboxylate transporter TctB family protein [Thalassospira mesophila]|uniref:tripartite tricarboxylate transporter TctB family protein n=1 Tax=Thalassospira mesophila TaxID=1293891 RepID=UPI000A1D931F|nr:tripartite tricarboxylate transporter TctB family protein [Thalassospira mesophila]